MKFSYDGPHLFEKVVLFKVLLHQISRPILFTLIKLSLLETIWRIFDHHTMSGVATFYLSNWLSHANFIRHHVDAVWRHNLNGYEGCRGICRELCSASTYRCGILPDLHFPPENHKFHTLSFVWRRFNCMTSGYQHGGTKLRTESAIGQF